MISILARGAIGFVLERLDDSTRVSVQACVSWALGREHSPVLKDRKKRANERSNPVNPVVSWEAAIDDSRSKGAGWIDAGCSKSCVSKKLVRCRAF